MRTNRAMSPRIVDENCRAALIREQRRLDAEHLAWVKQLFHWLRGYDPILPR